MVMGVVRVVELPQDLVEQGMAQEPLGGLV
jgi:hypothetical protein